MPRYIDADLLMKDIRQRAYLTDNIVERPIYAMTVLGIQQTVDEQPTISTDEVRGVVHCGECKFWRRPPSCEGLARCETGETGIRYRTKNDFCSRGAKMEVTSDA